ncbi:hypothetical protein [Spirosoma rigui]|uniref:hypothetical protein n=1 Tax=Spirosoma rigui TaxID=564064 RepID=UPI0009AFE93A|nr:hypothetical protein [Spirosoma rigui]
MNTVTELITPKALVRFMLYTDVNRQTAKTIGAAVWMDSDTVLGPAYACGTEHDLIFPEIDTVRQTYVVAMAPVTRQIPGTDGSDSPVLLATIYLARQEQSIRYADLSGTPGTVARFPRQQN